MQVDLARGFGEGTTLGTEPVLPQSSFPDGARHVGDFPGSVARTDLERDLSCDGGEAAVCCYQVHEVGE